MDGCDYYEVGMMLHCPNCDGKEMTLIHDKVWSIDDGNVYRCKRCDLSFIDPMMTKEQEDVFYKEFNKHVKARGVTSEESIQRYHEASLTIARERMEVVARFFQKQHKVLEIGSSTGAFLSLIKECDTSAVEPADENREFSKQFVSDSTYSSIEDVEEDEQFDIICMFHVFEHIREPGEFLKRCKRLLKADGIIVIEVPHIEDPLVSIYDIPAFKDFLFQPMHPMIYSVPSLDYIFNHHDLLASEVIYYQRYGLNNHLTWLKYQRPGGDALFDSMFKGDQEYKDILEASKQTDTLFYIAHKEGIRS